MRLEATGRERLDRFLARRLPSHSRSKLVRLIDSGEVLVGGRPEKPSFQLSLGDVVELEEPAEAAPHDLSPADLPLDVVFEDEDMLVVNKPRGLATHPAASLKEPSLVNALLGRRSPLSSIGGDFRPGIVHRLDKETTGLLVVAKNDGSHVSLARQIEGKSAERRYFAIVAGNVERPRFVIDAPVARSRTNRILMAVDPNGKRAVTHVKLLRRFDAGTGLAVRLETGRTHQIRVHLSAVGLPVVGDRLYAPAAYASGPLQLHAAYLEIDHPRSGIRMAFYAPPDQDFVGAGTYTREEIEGF